MHTVIQLHIFIIHLKIILCFEATPNLNGYSLITLTMHKMIKYFYEFLSSDSVLKQNYFSLQTRGELTAALPALRLRLCCRKKPSAEMNENVKSWLTRSTAWRGVWPQQTLKRGSRRSADMFISVDIFPNTSAHFEISP